MVKLAGKAGKRAQLIGAAAQRVRRRRSIWRLGAPRRRTRAQMQRRGGTGEREHVQRQPMGRRESGASATGCCHLVDRQRAGSGSERTSLWTGTDRRCTHGTLQNRLCGEKNDGESNSGHSLMGDFKLSAASTNGTGTTTSTSSCSSSGGGSNTNCHTSAGDPFYTSYLAGIKNVVGGGSAGGGMPSDGLLIEKSSVSAGSKMSPNPPLADVQLENKAKEALLEADEAATNGDCKAAIEAAGHPLSGNAAPYHVQEGPMHVQQSSWSDDLLLNVHNGLPPAYAAASPFGGMQQQQQRRPITATAFPMSARHMHQPNMFLAAAAAQTAKPASVWSAASPPQGATPPHQPPPQSAWSSGGQMAAGVNPWNRGRSAPNLNPMAAGSMANRKPSPTFNHHQNMVISPSKYRRSTSYPGKNAMYQQQPPAFDIAALEDNRADAYAFQVGPFAFYYLFLIFYQLAFKTNGSGLASSINPSLERLFPLLCNSKSWRLFNFFLSLSLSLCACMCAARQRNGCIRAFRLARLLGLISIIFALISSRCFALRDAFYCVGRGAEMREQSFC